MSLSRKELDRLGVLAAGVSDARTRANLGVGTQANVNAAVAAGTQAGQSAIGAVSFGAGTLSRLKQLGVEVDQAAYNLVSKANDQLIQKLTTQLEVAVRERDLVQKDPTSPTFVRQAAQNLVNATREKLDEAIAAATVDVGKQTRDAGKSFASAITSSWGSALTDLISGKATWREFTESILTTFTNQVIQTFMNGLLSPFTGENGIVTQALRGLGSKIFSMARGSFGGSGVGDMAQSAVSNASVTAGDESTGLLSGILSTLTSGIMNIGGFFGTLISGVASLFGITLTQTITEEVKMAYYGSWFFAIQTTLITGFGALQTALMLIFGRVSLDNPLFASGGLVRGPGTGTSDSITAQLSNGEFVVNAAATKKFLPLLAGINNGMVPKFAAGGLVSASLMASPAIADIRPAETASKNQSQQVININVTGDVSRQTRAEIQRMIPNIATGINNYNREKG